MSFPEALNQEPETYMTGSTLRGVARPGDELSAFQHASLLSGPGVTWSYRSPGYVLLAVELLESLVSPAV
jgi:hypothetical protein